MSSGSQPELGVVCKNCGSEVSPYVTECPYCGQRVRKRAPKLERLGEEAKPRPPRRRRVPKVRISGIGDRPYATLAALLAPAVLVLVNRASSGLTAFDLGAIVGAVDSEWWRYLAAPFVYEDLGYLFVIGVAVTIFGVALERRLGTPATATLLVGCGALGMLAADGLQSAFATTDSTIVAAGGNGVALGALSAWLMIALREQRRHGSDPDRDFLGVAVIAVVLLVLPAVEDWANVWAGLSGAVAGAGAGVLAVYLGAAD